MSVVASMITDIAMEITEAAHAAPFFSITVSLSVLWIFRRSILRSLDDASPLDPGISDLGIDLRSPSYPAPSLPIDWEALASEATRHRSALVRLYIWGGILLAVVLAAVFAGAEYRKSGISFVLLFLFAAICFAIPAVFIVRILYGRWRPSALMGDWKPFVIVSLVLLIAGSSDLSHGPLGVAFASIPVMALLLHHRIRAMGLLSNGFFTIFIAGMVLSLSASMLAMRTDIEANFLADPLTKDIFQLIEPTTIAQFESSIQKFSPFLRNHALFIFQKIAILLFVGVLASAVLGASLFMLIARWYSRKRFSDQLLIIASIWFFFALAVAPRKNPFGLAANMAAVTVLCIVVISLLPHIPRYEGPCVRLLMLRSFNLGERSGRLFQEIESLWRSIGSIQLVGGTDLALITLEPHDLLAWMRGGLQRKFVHHQVEVDGRLASFDHMYDPDGRYRFNVIFCHGDATWKYAVNRLLMHSDCVLLDVRGFTRHRAGCVFEIRTLAESALGLPVVFLVDRVTDRDFIVETWAAAKAGLSTDTFFNGPQYRFVSEQPADGSIAERIFAAFANVQVQATTAA